MNQLKRYLTILLLCCFLLGTYCLCSYASDVNGDINGSAGTENVAFFNVSEKTANANIMLASSIGLIGKKTGDGEGKGIYTPVIHDWSYVWDGSKIQASCSHCDATAEVYFNIDIPSAHDAENTPDCSCCPTQVDVLYNLIRENNWSLYTGAFYNGGGISEYHIVYQDADLPSTGVWQQGIPNEIGTYKVAFMLDTSAEVEDLSGDYGCFTHYILLDICHIPAEDWETDGYSLVLKCEEGDETVATVSLDSDVTHFACSRGEEVVASTTITKGAQTPQTEERCSECVVLYQGIGDTDYPVSLLQPTECGTYSMRLAVLADTKDPNSAIVETDTRTFTVLSHDWSYSSEEYSLYADCAACGTHAEVNIDTSTVYEASRTYDGGTLEYEVFYETNWSNQEDIEPYNVLFSGYETKSETSTTLYDRAFVKPTSTGNYSVRLSLLSDPDDPDSAWLSSKSKSYYLANITIGECSILTYGNEQIAQFTQPSQGLYYVPVSDSLSEAHICYEVGTLSEFLWCVYHENTSDTYIRLTNDIVVNPITVNESGEVRSASYQVYAWTGFGTEESAFQGGIVGNGYTIYGIYQPTISNHYSGLINYGNNSNISTLTVENSVVYGQDAAAVVGHYDCTQSNCEILNCHSLNCYIKGTSTAGGIVGWFTSSSSGELTLENCGNDSIICGNSDNGGGGILGLAQGADFLKFQSCYNLGSIESESGYGGGIIGKATLDTTDGRLIVWDCFNTGSVNCPKYEGGIIGSAADYKDNHGLFFDNCTSIGYLYSSKSIGGIAGYFDTDYEYFCRSTVLHHHYCNAKVAFQTADANVSFEDRAEKLTKAEANGGYVCSRYGHVACSHWDAVTSPSCTTDGELQLNCAICGAIMEDEIIRAYGHHFEYGECIYCGQFEDDDDYEGTVFSAPQWIVAGGTAFTLAVLACIWLIIRKKKKTADLDDGTNMH